MLLWSNSSLPDCFRWQFSTARAKWEQYCCAAVMSSFENTSVCSATLLIACKTPITVLSPALRIGAHKIDFVLYPVFLSTEGLKRLSSYASGTDIYVLLRKHAPTIPLSLGTRMGSMP